MSKQGFTIVAGLITMLISVPAMSQSGTALPGVWRQDNGSVTVRIADCPGGTGLCGTIIDERLTPGEPSLLQQTVVRDMKPSGRNSWAGKYIVDGQAMNAKLKQISADKISFKICAIAFLCETIRLNRVGR